MDKMLKVMDWKTRKIMTMNIMYYPPGRVTLTDCTCQEWKVNEDS